MRECDFTVEMALLLQCQVTARRSYFLSSCTQKGVTWSFIEVCLLYGSNRVTTVTFNSSRSELWTVEWRVSVLIFTPQLTCTLSSLFPSDLLTHSSVFMSLRPSSKHRKHVLENPACVSFDLKVRVSRCKINTAYREQQQNKVKQNWRGCIAGFWLISMLIRRLGGRKH